MSAAGSSSRPPRVSGAYAAYGPGSAPASSSSATAATATTTSAHNAPFTTEMRERQARGKDPYSGGRTAADEVHMPLGYGGMCVLFYF